MLNFYDVSLPIRERMIVYPGNPKPSIRRYSSIPRDKVNESSITFGSHTGTHVDSKLHIQNEASGAEALPLNSFYGKCKVLDLTNAENEIHRKDLESYQIKKGDIILLKTRNSKRGYREFRSDYVHVKLDAAKYLVEAGVKTLGFDYLSAKKYGGDDEVHEVLINNLTLFEGLNLAEVPEGEYIFIGLPLRINLDGAPARVILVEDQIG
ncbi:MAG: cyclase family protein [Candidatus Bathyarchaeota archaeon]|nr:cyclase family protein [Candidatus Bathyarchaeota archaeon]